MDTDFYRKPASTAYKVYTDQLCMESVNIDEVAQRTSQYEHRAFTGKTNGSDRSDIF